MPTATAKEYKSERKPTWCPGCGDFGVLANVCSALDELQIPPDQVVIVSGIGCSSRLPYFMRTYGFHTLHGRALPIAMGIKLANPKLTVVVTGGDGDAYSIGMGHLPHACRRNVDLTYVVMDNAIYGLTKGQTSPTSAFGFETHSTPYGSVDEPLNPVAMGITFEASFVARGYSAKGDHLTALIAEGIRHKGFSLIDVFSPCPTFNRVDTFKYYAPRVYEVPKDHDPTNKKAALNLAYQDDPNRIPIGVFYRHERPTLGELTDKIAEKARGVAPADLGRVLQSFA
jgi:2-oxoglutarate ferredoxin oxidoreductase subunit beta